MANNMFAFLFRSSQNTRKIICVVFVSYECSYMRVELMSLEFGCIRKIRYQIFVNEFTFVNEALALINVDDILVCIQLIFNSRFSLFKLNSA